VGKKYKTTDKKRQTTNNRQLATSRSRRKICIEEIRFLYFCMVEAF
jgi:hypothetical protein